MALSGRRQTINEMIAVLRGDAEQIVGCEPNQRASHRQLACNAVACGRVNSRVEHLSICRSALSMQASTLSRFTMKRILIILVFLAGICSVVAAQATKNRSDSRKAQRGHIEQELIELEKRWNDAYRRKDVAMLNSILADDIVIIYGDGTRATKSQDIASIGVEEQIESSTLDDFQVQVYGDTAVVMSRLTSSGVRHGKKFTAQFRYVDIYRKRGGRWQCVVTQNTRIGKLDL
jgi:ketosteroid isomerase-like protein